MFIVYDSRKIIIKSKGNIKSQFVISTMVEVGSWYYKERISEKEDWKEIQS